MDENEVAQLKLLADEIFGDNASPGQLIWKKAGTGRKRTKSFLVEHEYVLVYYKNKVFNLHEPKSLPSEDSFKNPDNDPRGPWFNASISAEVAEQKAKNVFSLNINGRAYVRKWFLSEAEMKELVALNKIYVPRNGDGVPRRKMFPEDFKSESKYLCSLILDGGSSTSAKEELEMVFGNVPFETPKPLDLLKKLIGSHPNKDARVLDFFAGSGTTGHAVLQLNAEDGGTRQCTLVTNDEGEFFDEAGMLKLGGICTHVTYPRLLKVIEGYTPPKDSLNNPRFLGGLS